MSHSSSPEVRTEQAGLPAVPVVAFAHSGSMDYRSYGYEPRNPQSRQEVLRDQVRDWTPQQRERSISTLSEAGETLKNRLISPRVRGLFWSRQFPRIFSLTGVVPNFDPDGGVQSASYHAKAGVDAQFGQVPVAGHPTLVHLDGWSLLSMGRSYDRRDPRRVDGGLRGGIGFGALGELAAQEVLSLAQEIYPGMYSVVENGPDQLDALPPTALTIGRSPSEDVDAGFYGVLRLPDRGPQQSTL